MEEFVIGVDSNGRKIISNKAPMSDVRIGGVMGEDGTPLVTIGDIVVGRLPDLATALAEVQRDLHLAAAVNSIRTLP